MASNKTTTTTTITTPELSYMDQMRLWADQLTDTEADLPILDKMIKLTREKIALKLASENQ